MKNKNRKGYVDKKYNIIKQSLWNSFYWNTGIILIITLIAIAGISYCVSGINNSNENTSISKMVGNGEIFYFIIGCVIAVKTISNYLSNKEYLNSFKNKFKFCDEFVVESKNIFSLNIKQKISGYFILGTGRINQDEYYFYFENGEHGLIRDYVPVKDYYLKTYKGKVKGGKIQKIETIDGDTFNVILLPHKYSVKKFNFIE